MDSLSLTDDTSPALPYNTYWHLDVAPWDHSISLLELFSKYYDKSYDEVTEIIDADRPHIQELLDEWSSRFKTQKSLVDDTLSEYGEKVLYPKWYKEIPWAKEIDDRCGGPDKYWKYKASRFFYLMPLNEHSYSTGYYDGKLLEDTGLDDAGLVTAMKLDYGVTVKYPYLPVFAAALPSGELHTWPMEMMHVSIAVPLMLHII
ncbi:hypothetical protein AAVH_40804 [Aphelenchoides avenae]|nr:hypothetical protein AAVH_40804 [Aphelenchus avenae]